jgi:hypothetical protein
MTEYTFTRRGATTGAVSGARYTWKKDQTVIAPDGEFAHLPDQRYSTRVVRPSEPDGYEVRHEGAGWWHVVGPDGEKVDVVRGEEKARQRLEEVRDG